eukprot:SAG31_NODE_1384_length_8578_cov_2.883359_8_plen_760_part_00
MRDRPIGGGRASARAAAHAGTDAHPAELFGATLATSADVLAMAESVASAPTSDAQGGADSPKAADGSAAADLLRSLDPAKLQSMIKTMKRPAADRTIAELGILMDVVAQLKFFQKLSFKLMQGLCRCLRTLTVKPGDTVFKQGDDGWDFYVTLSGQVDIEIDGRCVTTLFPGSAFGEQALIDDGDERKRSATVRCSGEMPSIFGLLSKQDYNNMLKKEHAKTLRPLIDFYSETIHCKPLKWDTLLKLAHVTVPRTWSKGDVIFRSAEPVDAILFLVSGECLVTRDVYLGAGSSLRGAISANLSTSGHPGLRPNTKKITIDIAAICGHGEMVGEAELLHSVNELLAQEVREKREAELLYRRTKGAKGTLRWKKPSVVEHDETIFRQYNVIAASDVEAFSVRAKDARRYIFRQPLAQPKLAQLNEWRQDLFRQRMRQWELSRAIQHEQSPEPLGPTSVLQDIASGASGDSRWVDPSTGFPLSQGMDQSGRSASLRSQSLPSLPSISVGKGEVDRNNEDNHDHQVNKSIMMSVPDRTDREPMGIRMSADGNGFAPPSRARPHSPTRWVAQTGDLLPASHHSRSRTALRPKSVQPAMLAAVGGLMPPVRPSTSGIAHSVQLQRRHRKNNSSITSPQGDQRWKPERSPLWYPKRVASRPNSPPRPVAFLSGVAARPLSPTERALASGEMEDVRTMDPWLAQWEAALSKSASGSNMFDLTSNNVSYTSVPSRQAMCDASGRSIGGHLDGWFEHVSYISSNGVVCG